MIGYRSPILNSTETLETSVHASITKMKLILIDTLFILATFDWLYDTSDIIYWFHSISFRDSQNQLYFLEKFVYTYQLFSKCIRITNYIVFV